MKNKKMLIIGVIALVAVAVWYLWLRKPKAEEKPAKEEQPPVKTAISAGGKRLIVPGYN